MQTQMTDKIKLLAGIVEKFVENNFFEKEQRDENLRKLALAFETFVRENPIVRDSSTLLRENSFVRDNPLVRELRNGLKMQKSGLQKIPVKVKKLQNFKGELPKYQTALASGVDVRAQLEKPIEIAPGQRALIATGLSFAIPEGFEIQSRPRSGWAVRDGITVLNTPGTIDADYRGEVKIIVINHGENAVIIQDQDRVAQLVLAPVVQAQFDVVDDLDATERGAGGFGSTGRE